MDTRFWGPSGWRLLHLGAHAADVDPSLRAPFKALLTLLPYALPCKYCRASLTEYLSEMPPPSSSALWAWSRFLHGLHNCVNAKLRGQGLLPPGGDPPFRQVHALYAQVYASNCTERGFVGWDFLFSVAFTTPPHSERAAAAASSPMPGAPSRDGAMSLREANGHNLLSRGERLASLREWWLSVGPALPLPNWRRAWAEAAAKHGAVPPLTQGRRPVTAWLFRMQGAVCAALTEAAPHASFTGLCAELASFASGCSAAKRGRTCRRRGGGGRGRGRVTLRAKRF